MSDNGNSTPIEGARGRDEGDPGPRNSPSERPDPRPAAPSSPQAKRLPARWPGVPIAALFCCAAAASIGLAAYALPPPAVAVVALVGSLCAVMFVMSRSRRHTVHEPIANLRRELDQTRRDRTQLFAAVPCFICVLDRDHQVIEANSLYRKEFDVTDRLLCYEICKQRSKPCVKCLVDQTFADGESYSSEETLVARDGRRINVVVHTQPVYDENGEISSVMEVFTDVTEVKRLQRQLALTGRAVAGMAHRVKNILMGLEGGIFIVNDGLDEDDREAIDPGLGDGRAQRRTGDRHRQGPSLLLQGPGTQFPGRMSARRRS